MLQKYNDPQFLEGRQPFMQEIMSRIRGYQETVHFRVLSASINGSKGNTMSLDFVVEDLTEEKNEDERKE